MVANYRGIGLAWLVLYLFAAPAMAVSVTVGELGMDLPPGWQRGGLEEEADFDSIILRQGEADARIEVFVPKVRAKPKTDSEQFIDQLEKSWRQRYGEKVELGWLESAGSRWRTCRRPSRSGDAHIYQVVADHAGEVYQFVVSVPPDMEKLPETVQTLLAQASWRDAASPSPGTQPVAAAVAEPAPPVQTAAVEAGPAVSVESAKTPEPPSPGPSWQLLRKVVSLPSAKSWVVLADAEGKHLGNAGMVSGLGMSSQPDGISAFMEGVLWKKAEDGGELRQRFKRLWQVSWPAVPERWPAGGELAFDLNFMAAHDSVDTVADLTVKVEITPLCAPRLDVVRWLDDLEKMGPADMAKIGKMTCKGTDAGPVPAMVEVKGRDYPAGADARLARRVELPLPLAWQQGIQTRAKGQVRRLALTVRFQVSEEGLAPGDAMLREAVAIFVFGPEV